MSTVQSPMITRLWDRIHALEPKAENSGSVGNTAHRNESHSYHESWDDQRHDNGYSVRYWGDKHRLGKVSDLACAQDITLPPELMIKYTGRLHHAALSGMFTARNVGLREVAGTLDGKVVWAYDLTSKLRTFGWDPSHLWHIHLSFNRRFINDPRILRVAEIFH